jgi:hypothetical protein
MEIPTLQGMLVPSWPEPDEPGLLSEEADFFEPGDNK